MALVYSLAENDILKVNAILELSLIETLNFLTYKIERDNVILWNEKNQ